MPLRAGGAMKEQVCKCVLGACVCVCLFACVCARECPLAYVYV